MADEARNFRAPEVEASCDIIIKGSRLYLRCNMAALRRIDNIVRPPYLISHDSHLSLLLIVLGMIGGIASVGFIDIFIGPSILAVGFTLVRIWTRTR